MNMFARFDENPAMNLRVIKKTKRYGQTDNVKTVYPPQTKFAPSKAVVGVDWPMKTPSMHIQKPY